MKLTVEIFKGGRKIEKIMEGDSVFAIITDLIKDMGGEQSKFNISCEKREGICEYTIFKGRKKMAVVRDSTKRDSTEP